MANSVSRFLGVVWWWSWFCQLYRRGPRAHGGRLSAAITTTTTSTYTYFSGSCVVGRMKTWVIMALVMGDARRDQHCVNVASNDYLEF